MAKKKTTKPLRSIDNVLKCSQQRRSSPPKRRTDFSLFCFRNSSSSNSERRDLFPSSLVQCSGKIQDEESGLSSDSSAASVLEVGLQNSNTLLEFPGDREVCNLENEVIGVLDYTPNKSYVEESKTLCVSPKSVTSSKMCELWFPSADYSEMLGDDLVKNSIAASNNSDEQDLSSDKSSSSIASRIDEDSVERGRGKRERKPKLHFDDISITMPVTSDRQLRRIRIMRHLGLTPPVGSPF